MSGTLTTRPPLIIMIVVVYCIVHVYIITFYLRFYFTHCIKNILNFRITKTESVTDGADGTVYFWFTCKTHIVGIYQSIYISVIVGTAPAIVLQSCDSPNLSPLCLQILNYSYLTICQSRHGESHLCKTMAVL